MNALNMVGMTSSNIPFVVPILNVTNIYARTLFWLLGPFTIVELAIAYLLSVLFTSHSLWPEV